VYSNFFPTHVFLVFVLRFTPNHTPLKYGFAILVIIHKEGLKTCYFITFSSALIGFHLTNLGSLNAKCGVILVL
jgi:hypothetical protein